MMLVLNFTDLKPLRSEDNLCPDLVWDRAREHVCNHACRFTG